MAMGVQTKVRRLHFDWGKSLGQRYCVLVNNRMTFVTRPTVYRPSWHRDQRVDVPGRPAACFCRQRDTDRGGGRDGADSA